MNPEGQEVELVSMVHFFFFFLIFGCVGSSLLLTGFL